MMPDEPAEQVTQTQDEGSQTSGLYPDLSSLDESTRATVEPLFKEWDAGVTRRFQEAAEFRKQWEPYTDLGIDQVPTEDLQRLLAFREIASDEAKFQEWWQSVGQEMGLLDQAGAVEDADEVQAQIDQALKQRLAPIEAAFEQQQQAARQAEARTWVDSQLDALAEKNGEFDRDAVCQLALAYEGAESVQKGFADYQRIVGNKAATGALQEKLASPEAPESGGTAATQVEPITTFAEAKEAARNLLRQAASQ